MVTTPTAHEKGIFRTLVSVTALHFIDYGCRLHVLTMRPVDALREFELTEYYTGYTNGGHLHGDMEPSDALKRIQTAGSISISPELFEKIYLSPQNNVKGDLRKTFANPTPL